MSDLQGLVLGKRLIFELECGDDLPALVLEPAAFVEIVTVVLPHVARLATPGRRGVDERTRKLLADIGRDGLDLAQQRTQRGG